MGYSIVPKRRKVLYKMGFLTLRIVRIMKENKPLVSAEELNALIGGWGETPDKSVDRFFPLRFWFVVFVAGVFAVRLLFIPGEMAANLYSEPAEVARLTNFLYFRGWFLLCAISVAVYAYINNWYASIMLFCVLLAGCVNLISDIFSVYADQLKTPTPALTIQLLLRVFVLWLVYISVKNMSRLPERKDRMNIFLPFKKIK